MGAITILRRTLYSSDESLFQRAFDAGLRAIGEPIGEKKAVVLNGENSYHVLFDGPVDCHAYGTNDYAEQYVIRGSSTLGKYRALIDENLASIHIESAKFQDDRTSYRQMAATVAELLDKDCVAIVDYASRRVVECTDNTPEMLRSENPKRVFAQAAKLVLRRPSKSTANAAPRIVMKTSTAVQAIGVIAMTIGSVSVGVRDPGPVRIEFVITTLATFLLGMLVLVWGMTGADRIDGKE